MEEMERGDVGKVEASGIKKASGRVKGGGIVQGGGLAKGEGEMQNCKGRRNGSPHRNS
jgi:hypothetical protein